MKPRQTSNIQHRTSNIEVKSENYALDLFFTTVQPHGMSTLANFVSLHPYFKAHPGKLDAFKATLPAFIKKTSSEEKNLFYEFTIHGDEIFCREAYADADGILAHLDNVGQLLAQVMTIADLTRTELHGPAHELDKLRGPLAHLKPVWFILEHNVD
ncbi:MAG: hypothetical protein M3Y27_13320 [Acidobacteriota bacterium]|nr:hypothetical protein [Acidobacteriota bacterium]